MENTSLQGHRHEHLESYTLFPMQYPGGSLDMQCSRQESYSRVFTLAFTFKAPRLFARCCATLFPVSSQYFRIPSSRAV